MSSQDIPEENLPAERADDEHAHGAVSVADEKHPFADPGLPPHEHRIQDIDERAAKRSERTVAFLFTLSMLATVGFIASFVTIPADKIVYIFPLGHISGLNFALGMTLGLALFCIGAGAVHWARTLMSDEEMTDERHAIAAEPEVKAKVLADFKQGAKESALGRRKLIRNTMFGALTLFPLSGIVLLRDLGPLPEDKLRHTLWSQGPAAREHEHERAAASLRRRRGLAHLRQARGPGGARPRVPDRDRQGGPDDRPAAAGQHQGQA